MTGAGKRVIKTLNTVIRKQSWDVEESKSETARALERQKTAARALGEVEQRISAAEQQYRNSTMQDQTLSLENLQYLRRYLMQQQQVREDCAQAKQNADVELAECTDRLKQRRLKMRSFEKLHARKSCEQAQEQQKKISKEMDELWLTRGRRK